MASHPFPDRIRSLPPFDGPFDAFRLGAFGCDVLFASYPAGTEIPEHAHETENCGLVTRGELVLVTGGAEHRVGPGRWYHLAPGQPHAARFEVATSEVEFWFEADAPGHDPSEDLGTKHQLHGVQPVLPVRDVAASAAFFRDVLGFEVDFLEGDPAVHGRIRKGDGSFGQPIYIHLSKAEPEAVRPSGELRIHVGFDLDGLFDAYRARGADVVFPPTTQPWGLREFALRELDGHVLRFCAEA